MFVAVRDSLVWLCGGNHACAAVLGLIIWIDALLARNPNSGYEQGSVRPGEWIKLSDRSIRQRMCLYKGRALFGEKAIGKAVLQLKALDLIQVERDPANKLSRTRYVRIRDVRHIRIKLMEWALAHREWSHPLGVVTPDYRTLAALRKMF